jgi:hypothetical protein
MTNRLLLEPSLRFDWDEILRRKLLSPRLAATYVLNNDATTKFSAGIGILYDATSLFLIARPSEGERLDYFFDANGQLSGPPLLTTFVVDKKLLTAPRFVNWSVGLEKLPIGLLKNKFLQKRGRRVRLRTVSGAPAAPTCFRTPQRPIRRFRWTWEAFSGELVMVSISAPEPLESGSGF